MNLEDLRALLDFHYWARDRLLDAVEQLSPEQFTNDMGSSFRSVRDTLVHIGLLQRSRTYADDLKLRGAQYGQI